MGTELFASTIARTKAEALAALGRTEEAREAITAGLALAREQGLAYEVAQLQLIEAEMTDDERTRARLLAEAESLLRGFGVVDVSSPTP